MELLDQYRQIWKRAKIAYETGYCLYERGMQAILYKETIAQIEKKSEFLGEKVIVEPRWEQSGKTCVPDLIIVGNDKIIDIFEIKFVPWHYPIFRSDVDKLLNYNGEHCVKLNPSFPGEPFSKLPISRNCKRHLVIVGKSDSAACQPGNISNKIILWYGKIGEPPECSDWGVCTREKHD